MLFDGGLWVPLVDRQVSVLAHNTPPREPIRTLSHPTANHVAARRIRQSSAKLAVAHAPARRDRHKQFPKLVQRRIAFFDSKIVFGRLVHVRILVLGGTVFVGRAIVESALARGHEVTIFHRGQSNLGLFDGAEEILGDRDGGLGALGAREWDSVIDTCGYVPRIVEQSVHALRERVPHYTFISTISVYSDHGADSIDENAALGSLEDRATETINWETYGPLKVLCEQAVSEGYGSRALILRPGLIVGPWDKTDRFTYWVSRTADGGEVLVPGRLDQPVQFIDVRDLAEWTLSLVEGEATGIFNASGPPGRLNLGEFLNVCNRALGEQATLVEAPISFLIENGVEAWTDLPLVNPYDGAGDGMSKIDISRAVKLGLRHRPLEDTILDTLAWFRDERPEGPLIVGISRKRELEVLNLLGSEKPKAVSQAASPSPIH